MYLQKALDLCSTRQVCLAIHVMIGDMGIKLKGLSYTQHSPVDNTNGLGKLGLEDGIPPYFPPTSPHTRSWEGIFYH